MKDSSTSDAGGLLASSIVTAINQRTAGSLMGHLMERAAS